jgi:hypothetical protein
MPTGQGTAVRRHHSSRGSAKASTRRRLCISLVDIANRGRNQAPADGKRRGELPERGSPGSAGAESGALRHPRLRPFSNR